MPRPSPPDFLCIGAMKAGTTWLQVNLGRHPRAWLSPLKELRYFNVLHIEGPHRERDTAHRQEQVAAGIARLREAGPLPLSRQRMLDCLERMAEPPFDDDWYRAIWGYRRPGQVAGDISPQYAVLPEAGIRHALALNPRLKVVALLREPAGRALSHMAMHAGPAADAAALRRMLNGPRWPIYAAQSDYATWLARWRDTLPSGALHVETISRIRREPLVVLERLCRFFGLPFEPARFAEAGRPVYASKADKSRISEALPEIRAALSREIAAFTEAFPDLAAELEAEAAPQA
jgi:hypothetical protein